MPSSSRLLGGGGYLDWGVCFQAGVCQLPGGSALGVPAPRGCLLPNGVSATGGLPAPGWYLLQGLSSPGGGGIPALRQTPPRGQKDMCKNITFATSLRTVKIVVVLWSLVTVNLVVAFGFLPQNFGRWWSLRIIVLLTNKCSLSGGDNDRSWGHSPPTG